MKRMKNTALMLTWVLSLVILWLLTPGCGGGKTEYIDRKSPQDAYWNDLKIWMRQPADQWDQGLVVGNGRIGAMLFGAVEEEHLQLNEDTLWSGGPHDYNVEGAVEHLDVVRQLILQGKAKQAEKLIEALMMGNPKKLQAYQPFGDLYL
ncbi:MAG: hypothetical protein E4H40_01190, partial [Candidatus Brocadiia bacterium]